MRRSLYSLALIGLASVLLSGCFGYNPQTSGLSTQEQCLTLQRQMLFVNPDRVGDSQWSNQVKQTELQKEFHHLNCYEVLSTQGNSNQAANQ